MNIEHVSESDAHYGHMTSQLCIHEQWSIHKIEKKELFENSANTFRIKIATSSFLVVGSLI